MTRTKAKSEIEKAEEWLDQLEPAAVPARDAIHLRRVIQARRELDDADTELHRVVAEARAAGEPWSAIGMALGTTRQAAHQRFSQDE